MAQGFSTFVPIIPRAGPLPSHVLTARKHSESQYSDQYSDSDGYAATRGSWGKRFHEFSLGGLEPTKSDKLTAPSRPYTMTSAAKLSRCVVTFEMIERTAPFELAGLGIEIKKDLVFFLGSVSPRCRCFKLSVATIQCGPSVFEASGGFNSLKV